MKPYNPIKAEEKIMNEPLTKDEKKFLDGFTLNQELVTEEELVRRHTMSKLDDALKRFEQVATLGMRESDYRQASDSLAWFREDLAVVKTVLLKSQALLGLYERLSYYAKYDTYDKETRDRVLELKDYMSELDREIEELK